MPVPEGGIPLQVARDSVHATQPSAHTLPGGIVTPSVRRVPRHDMIDWAEPIWPPENLAGRASARVAARHRPTRLLVGFTLCGTVEGGGHDMGSWKASGMQHWKAEMVVWLKKKLARIEGVALLPVASLRQGGNETNVLAKSDKNRGSRHSRPRLQLMGYLDSVSTRR